MRLRDEVARRVPASPPRGGFGGLAWDWRERATSPLKSLIQSLRQHSKPLGSSLGLLTRRHRTGAGVKERAPRESTNARSMRTGFWNHAQTLWPVLCEATRTHHQTLHCALQKNEWEKAGLQFPRSPRRSSPPGAVQT